jgi:hypothetical protein
MCLPNSSASGGGLGLVVDVESQPVVFGLVAGELPGDGAAHLGVVEDAGDLGLDLVAGAAGAAAGQGGLQLGQFVQGLGQCGVGEAGGLRLVQRAGMGEDGAPAGVVHAAAGVVGGQVAVSGHRLADLRAERGQVRAVGGGTEPM